MYDEYDIDLQKKLSNENARIDMICRQLDEEKSLGRRLKDFKKALSEDKILEEFDRGIFESMIDSVIVGGCDENGNKDPYKLTFIYKTGFTHEIDDAENKYVKKSKKGRKGKIMYSNAMAKVADVCTINVDDACGDGLFAVTSVSDVKVDQGDPSGDA